ncbi:VirB4 family type IV secretion/conjugal transfer ATPase [Alterisphingorhabdus coralli]|uniref:VirB4 family type IV secretion/conjugal transfer ATPase n=1 Tax=Alterisphingorhabdus coralli TaxID=3071408 RepID=A0AA97I2Z4_9SPHN|nr:VirB4 family type IV secretion/conjugal transfer ATPase [Parasphingorhabdus sp. SCSIO 66989]WOE76743.1 VirB4 family type IV secretion/conjugal transfer ATPase [Parasphingorhabdus sp. SCSIO 66989]
MFDKKRTAQTDGNARKYLPYKGHINEHMILCDNGEIFAVLRLNGRSFETMDLWEVNDWHNRINIALQSVGNERLAVHSYLLRSLRNEYPDGEFESDFSAQLDGNYRQSISAKRLYANELYMAVVERKAVAKVDKLGDKVKSFFVDDSGGEELTDRVDDLYATIRDLTKLLGAADPELLSTYEHNGLHYSETLEFMNRVMGGRNRKVPLVNAHLSGALATDRLIFGNELIEVREPSGSRWGGILGVKEHAAETFPGMLNGILKADFECVIAHSFGFRAKADAQGEMKRKLGQLSATDDVAISQTEGLIAAMDEVQSNRYVLGEYSLCVMLLGEDIATLNESMSLARAIISEGGIVAAREDLALEAAFWSMLPVNYTWRPRPAVMNSRNLAGLSPFHTYPMGQKDGNHWGPAVCLLKTVSRSPYYFNFHVNDIGHTLIIGPTGAGKTVLQNFLLSQASKLGTRQFFIDKDRGAEIYVRAVGGTYLALQNGKATGFAPLKALELTPGNKAFLGEWLRMLVDKPGERLSASDEKDLDNALDAMEALPRSERTLSALQSYLGTNDLEGIGARLERWTQGDELGWVFDNEDDELSLDAQLAGFDMTDFLDNDMIRPPLMAYLFHRIDMVIDGNPAIVDIDEFWRALGDASFRSFAKDGLKTYRKRNAMMLFGTQSPVDALSSDISSTIIEQCATKILLPNPTAKEEHYVDGLGLTKTEYHIIRNELTPESRCFLIKQGHNSVVAELDLGGMDDELAVLSGRASTLDLVTKLRAEVGDDPANWLPRFHAERAELR